MWISIPFFISYVIALLGNSLIIFVILTKQSLHGPMYLFLCMLAGADIVLSTSTVPQMLAVFWVHVAEISLDRCITQLFFNYSTFISESGILLVMAFDRYIAICYPLRYSSILTNSLIGKIGVAIFLRSYGTIIPIILLLKRLTFCKSNILTNATCKYIVLAPVSCDDIRINICHYKDMEVDLEIILGLTRETTRKYLDDLNTLKVIIMKHEEPKLKIFGEREVTAKFYTPTFQRPALGMAILTYTGTSHSFFILLGISLPFIISYLVTLLGNNLLVFVVMTDHSLHEPMYLFLCILALADFNLSTTTVPKALAIFWFHAGAISLDSCVTQIFFIHATFIAELGFLLAIAFDHYVPISDPLHYSTVLNRAVIIGLA
ncbi:Olfactory receptor 52B4 [Fukomys damarensis]|uniref:Olfactory receptor 52B4 n=1 Tax=Fukomys damarensis TaxID=885580 RepID=A0A091CWA9_FUKDA|nr:Olfactory receptor 52B4 [Fukomys damarensis]